MLDAAESRYRLAPLFRSSIVFILLAPSFWYSTMLPPGTDIARAPENAYLYESVYPSAYYGFERMRAGSLPLWNPTQWCGVPHMVRPPVSIFQPLNAVFLPLETDEAFAVQGFLCLFLAGAFFVLFARSLGTSYLTGIFGGISYAFGGATAAGISRPEIAAALAWAPLLFWAITEYPRRFRWGVVVIGGIGGAGILLSGSTPTIACILALAVPYTLLRTFSLRDDESSSALVTRVRGPFVMLLLAAGLSAVQWVPTVFWMRELADGWNVLLRFELAGRAASSVGDLFRQLVVAEPELLPHIGYFGVVALLSVPLVLMSKTSRKEGFYFLVAGTVFYLMSMLGTSEGGFPFAALIFPGQFSLSVAASLGLHVVFVRSIHGRRASARRPLVFLLCIAILLCFVSPTTTWWRIVIFMSLLGIYKLFRTERAGAVCAFCAAIFLYLDLSGASVNAYRHPFFDAEGIHDAHTSLLAELGNVPQEDRVFFASNASGVGVPANSGMLGGVRVAGGSYLPLTHTQERWRAALHGAVENVAQTESDTVLSGETLLNYMAVRAIVRAERIPLLGTPNSGDAQETLRSPQNILRVDLNASALPRAYWTPAHRIVENVEDVIDVLREAGFDGRRETVVVRASDVPETQTDVAVSASLADAEVRIRVDRPEYVELAVEAPATGITVLCDTFAPGWRATLDDERVSIMLANGLFRGVVTPAGSHTITFTYRPIPFWVGLFVSLATLVLLLLIGIGVLIPRRSNARGQRA